MSTASHGRVISEIEEHKDEEHTCEIEEHKDEEHTCEIEEHKDEEHTCEIEVHTSENVGMPNVELPEGEFEGESVLTWKKQVTVRAILVSLVLSVLFTFVVMKLTLTTGLTPSLNVSSGLLGLMIVKTWTALLTKAGIVNQPFTRQEHIVIRTCVAASTGIAITGGFGSYLFGMSPSIAIQNPDSSSPIDTKIPALGWMISFLFAVSFLGLFLAVPLRKLLIVDLKLPFSSATATADLISGYHTTKGARLTNEKIQTLGKYLSYSFAWGLFQWFFTAGEGCGFGNFPTFGLEAYKAMFYFDFSATYVGVGMLNQYITNISLLIGGILSWGVMWPFIEAKRGVWYPANLPKTNLSGFGGYQIFIPVGMVLGDGLYHFVKVLGHTLMCLYSEWNEKEKGVQSSEPNAHLAQVDSSDNKQTSKMFLKYQITYWFAVLGYVIISILSIIIILHIFHQLKWYYIAAFYIIAPAIVFCNAYGCGLTDYSLASTYGKLAVLTISAWVGSSNGGVTAGLVACGVMMSIVSTASDMIQDFKTGYMTLTSAKSMFLSQVIGTVMGCLVSPCVFFLFYISFPSLGKQRSTYPAPYGQVYRNMAILMVDGVPTLPNNCLTLFYWFLAAAIVINLIRDLIGKKFAHLIPVPAAMAIPFYIGSYYTIDMCVGSLIMVVWKIRDKTKAETFGFAVASGLICGDGIWSIPSSFLALSKVRPPICMKFLSRAENARYIRF